MPENHRLETCMQRRSRHSNVRPEDPSRFSPSPSAAVARSNQPPSRAPSSRGFQPSGSASRIHLQTQRGAVPRRSVPTHPFNLDNTLASINRNVHVPAARPRDQRRGIPRRYRESSMDSSGGESRDASGGVEVDLTDSDSSGDSSQTLDAGEWLSSIGR